MEQLDRTFALCSPCARARTSRRLRPGSAVVVIVVISPGHRTGERGHASPARLQACCARPPPTPLLLRAKRVRHPKKLTLAAFAAFAAFSLQVHFDPPAIDLLVVHLVAGALRVGGVGEAHESEAAGPARVVTLHHDASFR